MASQTPPAAVPPPPSHLHGHELVLGGQRSGKSRRAEALAAEWLARSPAHEALLVATAAAGDEEMRDRIERHRADRRARLPRLACVEATEDLAGVLRRHAAPHRLVIVDCLTLWLTRCMLPHDAPPREADEDIAALLEAVLAAPGPLVLVSNEIGLGVIPMAVEARRFVDELGRLHQALAARCARVTLMVAGLPLSVKDGH